MHRLVFLIFFAFLPLFASAQSVKELAATSEGDKGFITNLLESKLSGAGREILIQGFQGALSSRATFQKITIADADGVWLTINDGAIQWNRSALLRGRVEIAEMSAKEILLPRLPGAGGEQKAQAETTEFALPELPVGVEITKIQADRVELGEPVIGLAAAISVSGSMSLAGGEGAADLAIQRLDGPRGEFVLSAGYINETSVLNFNLSLDEDADGLLVNLIDLYDKPAVTAQISGEGPLDGFAADLRLATNGQPRVTGSVSISAENAEDGAPGRAFALDLEGDIAPLLPPDERSFFNGQTRLKAEGWRGDDGRINLPVLQVDTDAMDVAGLVRTNKKKAPQLVSLTIKLGEDAGATSVPVKLPGGGEDATVESGKLELNYDAAKGEGWTLTGRVGNLNPGTVKIGALTLDGAGQVLLGDDGELSEITGMLDFGGKQIAFDDPGLAQAVGEAITGKADFTYGDGQLEIADLTIDGADYGLSGYIMISDFSEGVLLTLDMAAKYEDLGRLSELADRPLTGAADASLSGNYTILTKSFDLQAQVNGTDISVDQEQLDSLIAGKSLIALDARRDETGIELRDFSIDAQKLKASAEGHLSSDASDITGRISLESLTDLGSDYGGSMEADISVSGPADARQLLFDARANDLALGIEPLDRALQGKTGLMLVLNQDQNGFTIQNFQLDNPQIKADASGVFSELATNATANVSLPDLSAIMPDWGGDFSADVKLNEVAGKRLIELNGIGQDLTFGSAGTAGTLTGPTRIVAKIEEDSGVITLQDVKLTNDQINATASGVYGEKTDITAKIDVSDFAPLGFGLQGSLDADASLRTDESGGRRLELTGTGQDLGFGQAQLDGALEGETRLSLTGTERNGVFEIETANIENARLNASASGTVGGGATDVAASLNAGDLRFLGNGISGAVNADARLVEADGKRNITAKGTANGLSIGQKRVDPLLRGQTSFDLAATQSDSGISVQRLAVNNPQLNLNADGDPAQALNIQGRLNDIRLVEPRMSGPVTVSGTLGQTEDRFNLDAKLTASGPTSLQIAGSAARDFSTTDISISGSSNASIANGFIRTRAIEGPLAINLRLNGQPSLDALSGQVRLSDGTLAEPRLGVRMEDLDVAANLRGGRIEIDGGGRFAAGGRITVVGPVDITAGTLDLAIGLDNVVARDPQLYETVLSGNLRMSGRNQDGPLISGQINVGETEILVPSTGLGGAKAIPDITHLGDRRPVRSTRARAGLEEFGSQASKEAGLGGPAATPPANPPKLDLVINAPNQIFIRGRGVDAEMGGRLQLQGTTRNVVPIGHLSLIRGRVDLLGKRFDFTEGVVELQGSLVPVIRLVAQTEEDGVTTRIIIDGEARDPDITFESSPELPEEEVLSHLLFGRGLDTISPLQAAQLANAIAVLAGKGGVGLVNSLRESVGLDDLDLATDDEGNVQVRAGKYLSDNLYSDVAVGDDGKTSVNLNLDISETMRARGSVDTDGESTIGVYFERDY